MISRAITRPCWGGANTDCHSGWAGTAMGRRLRRCAVLVALLVVCRPAAARTPLPRVFQRMPWLRLRGGAGPEEEVRDGDDGTDLAFSARVIDSKTGQLLHEMARGMITFAHTLGKAPCPQCPCPS